MLYGHREIILIEGIAGAGKSNLVAENHRLMAGNNSILLEGKFDQINRNIPYSSWIQVFNNFIEYLLTEDAQKLNEWQSKILDAMGANIGYLSQIVPNIKWIIEDIPQEKVTFTTETQNRFK